MALKVFLKITDYLSQGEFDGHSLSPDSCDSM
jgi:hypothetical protein